MIPRRAQPPPPPVLPSGIGTLAPEDFRRLADFIETYAGIKMPPSKATLLEGRLQRRVRATGRANLADYCRYLFDEGGLSAEQVHLIDAVSTNKTDFFREPEQFRILRETVLPALVAAPRREPAPQVAVWSAACSTGAEPYTIAMVLAAFAAEVAPIAPSILATDINTEVLATAQRAIYPEEEVAPVALPLRQRFLLRSRDPARRVVRIAPELRRLVRFARLNLTAAPYDLDELFDVIFCRNVLIYFGRTTQLLVLRQLCRHLRPGGALFLGHSESIHGMDLPLQALGNNAFRRV